MRLRTMLLAVAATATVAFPVSTAAYASEGEFSYHYYDEDGNVQAGSLIDLPDNECHSIPEVAGLEEDHVFRPFNDTDASAAVYKEDDCSGDPVVTLAPGARSGDETTFRAVRFTPVSQP